MLKLPHLAACMLLSLAALSCRGPRAPGGPGAPAEEASPAAEPYPLSPQMAQLEQDVASAAYRRLVKTFIRTDLAPELLRLDAPDSAQRFLAARGGPAALEKDEALRAAYERRRRCEEAFLSILREEYVRLNAESAFEAEVEAARRGGEPAGIAASAVIASTLDVEPILAAPGAERFWPGWRGPSAQGLSREAELPLVWSAGEHVAWRTEIPGAGNSSPVIWGDRIFLSSAFESGKRRTLLALRRSDGEILWSADAPFVPPEGRVRDKNGYASATPATDGERVVVFFGNTGLVAFDFEGQLLWHRPVEPFDAMHGTGASPVLCGDLAILFQEQSSKPSLGIAVDKRSGEVRWRIDRAPALGWCTPVALRVGGRDELIYGGNQTLKAYDPWSGRELWSLKGPTQEVVPSVAYGHGLIYCTSGRNGPTLAVRPGGHDDVTATHLVWRAVRGGPHVPSPVLWGDLLYLLNDTGIVTCLEARSGETVYQNRLQGKFSASPIAAAGRIYFANEDGDTFVVRAGRRFEVLAINSLGEGILASPAVLDGRIYLRGAKHLFAIE
jgi:outer membrane protein assembly factor BamB